MICANSAYSAATTTTTQSQAQVHTPPIAIAGTFYARLLLGLCLLLVPLGLDALLLLYMYFPSIMCDRLPSQSQESRLTAARTTARARARRPPPSRLLRKQHAATRAATQAATRTTLSSAARARRRRNWSTSDARGSPTGACAAWRSNQRSPNWWRPPP